MSQRQKSQTAQRLDSVDGDRVFSSFYFEFFFLGLVGVCCLVNRHFLGGAGDSWAEASRFSDSRGHSLGLSRWLLASFVLAGAAIWQTSHVWLREHFNADSLDLPTRLLSFVICLLAVTLPEVITRAALRGSALRMVFFGVIVDWALWSVSAHIDLATLGGRPSYVSLRACAAVGGNRRLTAESFYQGRHDTLRQEGAMYFYSRWFSLAKILARTGPVDEIWAPAGVEGKRLGWRGQRRRFSIDSREEFQVRLRTFAWAGWAVRAVEGQGAGTFSLIAADPFKRLCFRGPPGRHVVELRVDGYPVFAVSRFVLLATFLGCMFLLTRCGGIPCLRFNDEES